MFKILGLKTHNDKKESGKTISRTTKRR